MNENEHAAGTLTATMLAIYKDKLEQMKATGDVNVSLLKEVREFLKQHSIELDANDAPMQDLKHESDELAAWRETRSKQSC